ncbi:MAG TPA: response regulator [Candidatus Hydrogenedentes bacterium]|nr:response regulator [Candidatus Hydrogenedentota bacterium]HIJ72918.1 response regulator [Candidatus Hydrogenedentota bacterium]
MKTASRSETRVLLLAEDDPEDSLMVREALAQADVNAELHTVEDGRRLMDYLRRQGEYGDPARSPRPNIILLDLNMPNMDGRQAIAQIKDDPALRHIPLVVLTASRAAKDIGIAYESGASSFIKKPASFSELVDVMKKLAVYWLDTVELPPVAHR